MPSKCCGPTSSSNYDFTIKTEIVYKFSVNKNEKAAFSKAIPPQNLVVTKCTVVYKKTTVYFSKIVICHEKYRPAKPPSVFQNISNGCFFKHPTKRYTCRNVKTLPSLQSVQKDEIKNFTDTDQLKIDVYVTAKYNMLIYWPTFFGKI